MEQLRNTTAKLRAQIDAQHAELNEVCATLQERLNAYSATLHEFKFENNEFGGGERVRGFVAIDETTMVGSDLVMFVEDKGAKLLIYMGGELKVENLDLSPKSN